MFDQIDIIVTTQEKNKNGEKLDIETRITVPATKATVSRSSRDTYFREGLGRALRFKFNLYGPSYYDNITHFIHNNVKYAVTDLTTDTTGTSYFIEGVNNR